jgi:hypothetical protein
MRVPQTKHQAENETIKINNRFIGEYVDVPGSELPDGAAARNINCIDRGDCSEGRPGSKIYTEAVKPSGTLNGRCDHKKSGLVISAYDGQIYVSDKALSYFEEVFMMRNVAIGGECKIIEYNDDAVIIDESGIYLLVLSDYFRYVRKMNVALPETLITDVAETETLIYGYRYLISFLQRSGNATGEWTRLSEGRPPIFESGTTKPDENGKDYGEVFFESANYPSSNSQNIGDILIPTNTDPDSKTITDVGIYGSKNIGRNTDPPGVGLGGIGNNPALLAWKKDIPVAKAIVATQSGTTVTVSQGSITQDDCGNTLYWYNAGGYGSYETTTIMSVLSESTFTVSDSKTRSATVAGIGHGRLFAGYQTGDRFFTTIGTPFEEDDEGCPIFIADGRILWIKEYVSSSEVIVAYSQEIEVQGATIYPPTGYNFIRKYNDGVVDDATDFPGEGLIGIQDRIDSKQPIYWPRRYYSPLPSGDIGHIDFGFIFIATRDETIFKYTDIGAKKYTLGYYRADHQKETVDTHIKDILTVGGTLIILLANKTRGMSPQTASDVGSNENAESIYKIPPSYKIDDKGVALWRSIVFKGGNIIAITNEPAVRLFNGTAWSEINYAKDQVQKYIETIDPSNFAGAVYIPGRFGGYHIWFKRWRQADD